MLKDPFSMTRSRGSAPSQRQLRVGEEIRHALARILARGELRDPALIGVTVTVTEVRISPDLKNATAFITPLGGGDVAPLLKAYKRAAPFLRGQLAREVELRAVPDLRFAADTSFDQATRIEQLITSPDVRRDLDRDAD